MRKNNIKKAALAVSVLGLGLIPSLSVSAWGPERDTFTMAEPASYPVFNSITDNPTIGDERDFVKIGEIDADVTDLGNEVVVVPGRQYLVYIYFHNNASASINDSAHGFAGIAMKTRMSSSFSTVLTPAEKGTITGTITAENTNPLSVWDEAYMTTSTDKVLMHYVAGSAKIYNDFGTNNTVLSTNLFTEEGTLLGLDKLNGVIPGCEEYHGVVTYVLQAEELGGSIDKSVSKDGKTFKESIVIQPGEEATYQLAIHNTGDVELTNAVIKDTLPAGLTLVPGSTTLRANESTTEDPLSDDIFGVGFNLGTIGTGNTVYVTYKVKAGDDFDCTGKELTNEVTLTYDSDQASGDSRKDTSTITVKKVDGCEEPETPLDTCETNPTLEGCEPTPKPTPTPEPEKNCKTNPEMEGCDKLPSTGPLEIVMAVLVVLGVAVGGYYLYRTRRTLKTVENDVTGKETKDAKAETKPEDAAKDQKASEEPKANDKK